MSDFPWTAVVSVVASTIILTALGMSRDRLPRLARLCEWAGTLALLGALGLLIAVSPGIGLVIIGAFLLMSLLMQLVSNPSRIQSHPRL